MTLLNAETGPVEPDRPPEDSISVWLNAFSHLLRFPDAERQSIRDEIEAHLRERVRDLMLANRSEHDAIQQAVEELGGSAALAGRFHEAEQRFRKRRLIMNIATLGVAGVAVVAASTFTTVSVVNLTNDPRISIYDQVVEQDMATAELESQRVSFSFFDTSFADMTLFVADQTETYAFVHWHALEQCGVDRETLITTEVEDASFVDAMSLMFGTMDASEELAWRVYENRLEFATSSFFDRRERILVTFDIGDIIFDLSRQVNSRDSATEQLERLIHDYVEPVAWEANGGDSARLRIVGNKMFVKAPPRFLDPIAWMLNQLADSETDVEFGEGFSDGNAGFGAAGGVGGGEGMGGGGMRGSGSGGPGRFEGYGGSGIGGGESNPGDGGR